MEEDSCNYGYLWNKTNRSMRAETMHQKAHEMLHSQVKFILEAGTLEKLKFLLKMMLNEVTFCFKMTKPALSPACCWYKHTTMILSFSTISFVSWESILQISELFRSLRSFYWDHIICGVSFSFCHVHIDSLTCLAIFG